jgi:hypothetical protein
MSILKVNSIIYSTEAWVICLIVIVLMFAMVKLGHMLKLRSKREFVSMGPIEASTYGLFALILVFTFNMSTARFDARRGVVIEEVNNLATAMLRVEGFGNDSIKHDLYVKFKLLLDQRIKTNVTKTFDPEYDSARFASYKIVRQTVHQANNLARIPEHNYAANQLVNALLKVNESITNRYNSMTSSVPDPIIILLIVFALLCSLFAGFSFPKKDQVNWLPIRSFILFTALMILLVLDLDRPKRGFITIQDQFEKIVDLKKMLPKDLEN